MENNNEVPVVVTTDTDRRGVFFGYKDDASLPADGIVTIRQARMCVYWSTDVRGVVGLAAKGPTDSCRITPACELLTVNGVTSVMKCSEGARKAWEKAPWMT